VYELRKANVTGFDGQSFWQPIKKILSTLNHYNANKWKPISEELSKEIMSLNEYTINDDNIKIINENNHFLIQQVRIPLTEKATINKIIQVALNIGQSKAVNVIKFTCISDFIYDDDIVQLSSYITDEMIEQLDNYLSL
jgi:hypothetical protein